MQQRPTIRDQARRQQQQQQQHKYRLLFEIRCNFGDERKPHWVTADWRHTEEDAKKVETHWQKRGPTKLINHNKKKEKKKER